MRISAEIIDDEPDDPLLSVVATLTSEKDPEKPEQIRDLNWFFKKFALEEDSDSNEAPPVPKRTQMRHHFQNMHEEVTQKFQHLHLSDTTAPSSYSNIGTTASSSKDMETPNEPPQNPPVLHWLQQYLLKMKQDIKKEVLDELLSSGSSTEAKSGKSPSSTKLHDLQDTIVHKGIYCDNCDQMIHGIRYKCVNCSDFDLCQECESLPYIHNAYHMFLKVRHPLPLKLKPVSEPQGIVHAKLKKPQSKKLYEARFIRDETIPDSTVLNPNVTFVKSWRIINSGTRVWNHNTKLQLIQGSMGLTPTTDQVEVPHLRPGEVGVVSVVFRTPNLPGLYRSHWNFYHKSRPFGDMVWCHVIVHTEGGMTKHVLDKICNAPNIVLPPKVNESPPSETPCIEQVLSAVKKEHERGNMVPRKLVASSHTATPNNTPFDLSPPKSPDHHETAVKELQNLSPSVSSAKLSDNEDDVVSLTSSESDTEFVVIPMPKCFNMSESFLSENIPPWVENETLEADCCTYKLAPANIASQIPTQKLPLPSETVSQETGVPELSPPDISQTVIRIVEEQQDSVTVNCLSITSDGSSSEISIIESQESSPTLEEERHSSVINISVTSEGGDGKVEEDLRNEEVVGIPTSITFPKFPVEGITSTFDPSSPSHDERTVQVLPEGLVTGALSAAASVYNTARAAINAMQTRTEQGTVLSSNSQCPMEQLAEMGFCNRSQNGVLLQKHKGDVALVVAELVSLNDNDWSASRHAPNISPPAFD